jgi:hypothetical protein
VNVWTWRLLTWVSKSQEIDSDKDALATKRLNRDWIMRHELSIQLVCAEDTDDDSQEQLRLP